ncbi:hypothetical protein ILUMI_01194 [Ignelater luminosus]|uniref:Uncharacterized protein n=1 Tax=Ignelater luminosus TaxID=2038154 RepID=A0A8K0DKS2_IGNLU|nr:hypothetical protein ILUMI_01194 [Ignelater luminosus]
MEKERNPQQAEESHLMDYSPNILVFKRPDKVLRRPKASLTVELRELRELSTIPIPTKCPSSSRILWGGSPEVDDDTLANKKRVGPRRLDEVAQMEVVGHFAATSTSSVRKTTTATGSKSF